MIYSSAFSGALLRGAVLLVVATASGAGAYGVLRARHSASVERTATRTVETGLAASAVLKSPHPSGRHVIAFVLLSSECGFCTDEQTKTAIRGLRNALRTSLGGSVADLSVVGVAIDPDVEAGLRYLREIGEWGKAFDAVSAGGLWLNEEIVRLVWRQGLAEAALPQVVLIERDVDASDYPRRIDVSGDSLLLTVTGRTDLITWVSSGAPLRFVPIGP